MAWSEVFESIMRPKIPDTKPWSIAEMRLSQQDYEKLVEALSGLSSTEWLRAHLMSAEQRDGVRLFLVAVLCEHARRHTPGGQIWSCMRKLPMLAGFRDRLFSPNGQPRVELKNTVVSTANRWGLRHVFDVPGRMEWFGTLFLQFGFSFPAAQKSMPLWLSGNASVVAANYLLFGDMQSPTFASAWRALGACRRNQITEQRCRDTLKMSPWILEGWIPELVRLAKTKLHLSDVTGSEVEEQDPVILGEPSLIWPQGEEPFFRCEVLAATTFDLEESTYEIRSHSFDPVRILRREEGIYEVLGDGSVHIPLQRSEVQFSLVAIRAGSGEEEIATQSLAVWDRHYPITLYRQNNGKRMRDPEHPDSLDQGCFAIFHESFTITPQPSRALANDHWWLAELPACQASEPALSQDGEKVWWPEEHAERIRRENFPIHITALHGNFQEWTTPDNPPNVQLSVTLPDAAELRWIRIGNEVIDFNRTESGRFLTTPFTLRPEHVVYPLYATVGFSVEGKCFRETQRIRLNLLACFLETQGKLSIYDPVLPLNTRNARQFLFHIHTPEAVNQDNAMHPYWIHEGSRPVKKVTQRGIALTDLAGYGEPLTLYHGLFNSSANPKLISNRVRDNGIIKRVKFDSQGFTLDTTTKIELDDKHELVAWCKDHRFLRLGKDRLKPGEYDNRWYCDLTEFQDELGRIPLVSSIGFFYDGCRIGNWFDHKFHYTITGIKSSEEAARCAEMLRWFKAPVLDSDVASSMVFLLKRYIGDVIPVWLCSDASPELKLNELAADDEWFRVISILCRSVSLKELTLAEASQIIEEVYQGFDPADLENSLPEGLELLEGVGANLIAKIAHLYLSAFKETGTQTDLEATKQSVLSRFRVRSEELDRLCGDLMIHPNFLSQMFRRMIEDPHKLTTRDRHNMDLLLNHGLLRRLLTYNYIKRLTP